MRGIGPDEYINYRLNDDLPKRLVKSQLASDILTVLNQKKSVFVTNQTLCYSLENPEDFTEIDTFAKDYLHAQWVEYEHYTEIPTDPNSPMVKGIIFYRQE